MTEVQNQNTTSALQPDVNLINLLLNSGVQYGHVVGARHPQMKRNIHSVKNKTHIIDVRKTAYYLQKALDLVYNFLKKEKRILFVSTNPKFEEKIKELANQTGQYYVTHWRGGTLTNWRTIVSSIKTLKKINTKIEDIEKKESEGISLITKKEKAKIINERDKLNKGFGGIVNMGGMPDLVIVFSVKDEHLAINEANCVGIPVVGIVDTNASLKGVDYPIPGNDDSLKAIECYSNLFKDAILMGMKEWAEKKTVKKEDSKPAKTEKIDLKKQEKSSK